MKLIGVNGFQRSGKGTVAGFIEDLTLGVVVQVGFADKLKIMAARALGYSATDAELIALMDEFKLTGHVESYVSLSESQRYVLGPVAPVGSKKITGRRYLQNFGNDARQVFGDTFWIDQVLPRESRHLSSTIRSIENERNLDEMYFTRKPDVLAITDLRYPNEAERVLALGGEVWEVVRPGLESDGHASEQPLPRQLVTRTIDNNSTLDNLQWMVDRTLELYGQ